MKKLLFVLLSLSIISELPAQNNDCADMSTLLENKVWKAQLPQDKQYTMEMEFRDAGWRSVFLCNGKRTETFYSYSLFEDTIKVFESGKKFINVNSTKTCRDAFLRLSKQDCRIKSPVAKT